ncbi:hypothetical protein J4526_04015 [Desulfurococcaceae archaeon MEX13E-LK6-19]|nr:hypothetical protein J4526_04015 [Desulfurococcaceae archaeon MEX13E-LK6-19]
MDNMGLIEEIPVPIFYTPIKCNNPVIVHNHSTRVEVNLDTSSGGNKVEVSYNNGEDYGRVLANYIKKFIDMLSEYIAEEYFSIEINIDKPVYGLGLYAFITTLLLKEMDLPDDEVLRACSIIDEKIVSDPVRLMVLKALRTSVLLGTSIIYRGGEKPVELNIEKNFVITKHLRHDDRSVVTELFNEQAFRAAVIHLGGYTAIALAKCCIAGLECSKLLTESLIVFNSLQYMVKGVTPPLDGVLLDDLPGYLSLLVLEDDVSERDSG